MFSGTMTLVLLIRDVTHRNYIKMLKKQNKHKSDTLSFVSHEYRTPLNCIIEMLTTALESKGSSPHFIKCALDNSKYLHNLSNDLLDHAQMKVGKFEITVMEFNLYALAGECLEMFQLMASNKNLILQLQYDRCTRNEVVSDPNRVKQIIVNLIGNAFKFTLKG
jgi:signal transduction histidine kinase